MFSMTKSLSRQWRGKMRKALTELSDAERETLLCLANLGAAACLSGLIVSILKFISDLF